MRDLQTKSANNGMEFVRFAHRTGKRLRVSPAAHAGRYTASERPVKTAG